MSNKKLLVTSSCISIILILSSCGYSNRNSAEKPKNDGDIAVTKGPFNASIAKSDDSAALYFMKEGRSYGMTLFMRGNGMVCRIFSVGGEGKDFIIEDENLNGNFKVITEKESIHKSRDTNGDTPP